MAIDPAKLLQSGKGRISSNDAVDSQANRERLRELVRQRKVIREVLATLPDLADERFEVPADILEAPPNPNSRFLPVILMKYLRRCWNS